MDGGHTFYPSVNAFDTDHPPFGWWRAGALKDPGALRFNHQTHLCLNGKVLRGIDGPLGQLKKQECGFCHQPDANGGRMAPVRYDKHCALCHPLTVQIAAPTKDLQVQEAVKTFCEEPAPHVAPHLVLAILRERLRLLARQNPLICTDEQTAHTSRRIPGRQPDQPPLWHDLDAVPQRGGWIDDQASSLQRLLYDAPGGCRYCHIDKDSNDEGRMTNDQRKPNDEARISKNPFGPDGRKLDEKPLELRHSSFELLSSLGIRHSSWNEGLPDYEPTNVPASWFPHAKFSHARHSLMQCSACHEKARTSTRTADVLMPLRSKCVECHNNQKGSGIRARTNCLECHQYHGSAEDKETRRQGDKES